MYTHMHTHMHAYTQMHTHTHTHAYAHIRTRTHTSIRTRTRTHIRIHAHPHAPTPTHTHTLTFIWVWWSVFSRRSCSSYSRVVSASFCRKANSAYILLTIKLSSSIGFHFQIIKILNATKRKSRYSVMLWISFLGNCLFFSLFLSLSLFHQRKNKTTRKLKYSCDQHSH